MPTIFRDPVYVTDLDTGQTVDLQTFNLRTDVLEGWNNTSGVDAAFVSRGGGNGARSTGRWLSKEKYITLGGMAWQPGSRGLSEEVRDLLWGIFNPEARLALDRVVEGVSRRMFVRVYDVLTTDEPVEDGFRFTIPLVALDPFKYGSDVSVVEAGAFYGDQWFRSYTDFSDAIDAAALYPGSDTYPGPDVYPGVGYSVSEARGWRAYQDGLSRTYLLSTSSSRPSVAAVRNLGNTSSDRVKVTIHGPLEPGAWSLVNETTRQTQVVDVRLPSTGVLVLDSFEQTALVNGNDYTDLTYGDWMRLAPGANSLRLVTSAPNEDAYMTVESYSSWR